jgi:hypothetical protein
MSRIGDGLRRIEPEYARLTFDKAVVARPRRDDDAGLPAAELCGPGHPLFDALVSFVIERTVPEVAKGAVFFDPDIAAPTVVHFLLGDIVDGNAEVVRRALAVARVVIGGTVERGSPASLFDVIPADADATADKNVEHSFTAPVDADLVMWAREHLFEPIFEQARDERAHVAAIQDDFLRRSFNGLLARADEAIFAAEEEIDRNVHGAEGRLRKAELVKQQHELRRTERLDQTTRGRLVKRGDVVVVGSALLLPMPAPTDVEGVWSGDGHGGLSDPEIEQIAVRIARRYETDRGASVHSVEADNVGFDLLSLHGLERRCIEVKGRAGVGRVELTWSEFAKCQELGADYWLYVVLDCGRPEPRLYRVQNPAQALATAWQPSLDIRYGVDPEPVIEAAKSMPA